MRHWRLLPVALVLFILSISQAQVQVTADMPTVLEQGTSARASITLRLLDDSALGQGVWFLNVIQPLGGGEVRQVSAQLFSSAADESGLFRRVHSGAALSAGLSTVVEFEVRMDAPPGDYLIALQLFEGRNTNPSRVDPGRRVAMEFLPFTVVARGG